MPKLISDNPDFYEIQRDDGTPMKVVKSAISESQNKYFSELPKIEISQPEQIAPEPANDGYTSGVSEIKPQIDTSEQDLNNFEIGGRQSASVSDQVSTSPYNELKTAVAKEANAEAVGNNESSSVMSQGQKDQDAVNSRFQTKKEELDTQYADAISKYKEVSDEYLKSKEIDQDRYWNNLSTGRKIAAGIGLALASLNPQSMQGALSAINGAIDRDIEAQKLEIAKKKDAVNMQNSIVGKFYQKYKDLDAAQTSAKMLALEKTKAQLESVKIKSNNRLVQAKAETAIAKLNVEMMSEQEKLKQQIFNAGKKEREEVRSKEQRFSNINTELQELDKLIESKGTYELLGSHENELRQKLDSVAIDAAKLFDPQSVARESEVAAFRKMLFEPSITTRNKTARDTLESFKKMLQRRYQNDIGKEKYSDLGFKTK